MRRGEPVIPEPKRVAVGVTLMVGAAVGMMVLLGIALYFAGPYLLGALGEAENPETPVAVLPTLTGAATLLPGMGQPTQPQPAPTDGLSLPPTQPVTPAVVSTTPAAAATVVPSNVDIEALLAQMTLEEKVGQMIMAGIAGQAVNATTTSLIQQYHIGSIVYFGENTASAEQTLALSQGLQTAAAQSGRGVPLLIAVDHEGGTVFRFRQGLTHFPNLMALGATGSETLAFQTGAANAAELKAVGVNLDLGPVLDVNDQALNPVIGVRALGGSPDLVSRLGAAYINGVQTGGVIAAAKHYPGHGSTTADSHETLPVVQKSLEELRAHELAPFQAAVEAGVGVMMAGHIAFPQVETSGGPASLSGIFITDILRGEMGFNGVVMTDALSMGAIEGGYDLGEAAVRTVLAGTDLLAYTSSESAINAHRVLVTAAQTGRIPAGRIDAAARRVLELKRRFGLFAAAPPTGQFDREGHAALARLIAQQAITLQGTANPPLLAGDRVLLVTPDVLPAGGTAGDGLSLLGERLTQGGVQVDEWIYPVQNAGGIAATQTQAVQALGNYPQAVVVTWEAVLYGGQWGSRAQIDLVTALQASGKPVIVVAGNSPFDMQLVPASGVGLALYGGLDYQVEALAEALLAATLPTGRLPVTIGN